MKTLIMIKVLNFLGITFLLLGFCTECQFLYLGTFLVMVSETISSNLFFSNFMEGKRLEKKYKYEFDKKFNSQN